jgi:spore germination cell wall hydrolase CwlJ-like protein
VENSIQNSNFKVFQLRRIFLGILVLSSLLSTHAFATAPKKNASCPAGLIPKNCQRGTDKLQALTCNAYFEAGNQGFNGMVEVNRTVIARATNGTDDFPASIIGVIYQPSQFSWTLKIQRCVDPYIWEQAMNAAKMALRKGSNDKLYYHATYVSPRWKKYCTGNYKLGDHIFYSDCSRDTIQVARNRDEGRRGSMGVR